MWVRETGRPTSAALRGSRQHTSLPPSRSDSFKVRFLSLPAVIQTAYTDNMVCDY